MDRKIILYQPFIPVIETHLGFDSKETATKVGEIVLAKILKHQNPSISLDDLRFAGVIISEETVKKKAL